MFEIQQNSFCIVFAFLCFLGICIKSYHKRLWSNKKNKIYALGINIRKDYTNNESNCINNFVQAIYYNRFLSTSRYFFIYLTGLFTICSNSQSNQNNQVIEFFVRPAEAIYGTGSGLSYENAFSGSSNINWDLVNGNILNICGEHFESINILANDVNIIGNNSIESGSINGSLNNLNTGMNIDSKTGIVINNLTITNCTVQCLLIQGTSMVITNDCTFKFSGNQAIQHLHSATAIHNNPTCTNNLDDGISQHDNTNVIVNGGVFANNEAGINTIFGCTTVINGSPTFANNDYDIWAANAFSDMSCTITANGCVFPNKVLASNGAKLILNDCNVNEAVLSKTILKGYLVAKSSVIENLKVESANQAFIENCTINDINTISNGAFVEAIDSYIKPVGIFDVNSASTIRLNRCFIDGSDCADHIIDLNSNSAIKVTNSIFYNPPANKYALVIRTGSLVEAIENINIIGLSNVGRGVLSQIDLTIKNSIITGLQQGINIANGFTTTVENCTLFNNFSNSFGSGTLIQINSQNSNPLFVNTNNLDFKLDVDSPCIGAGQPLDEDLAIYAANWNLQPPYILKGSHLNQWNIGAYSSNLLSEQTTTLETLCGETLTGMSQKIYFEEVENAQEYTFSITNTATDVEHEIITTNRYFKISEVPNFGFNNTYAVKGKVKVDGSYGSYGTVCTLQTPDRLGKLRDNLCNQIFTKFNENLKSIILSNATAYKFKLVNGGNTQEVESATSILPLLSFENILPSTTYQVSVAIEVNGAWLPYGEVCNITTAAIPTTTLRAGFCNGTSPTLTRNFRATTKPFATAYRFKTTISGSEVVVEKATPVCNMSEFAGAMMNQTYNIQVAMQVNGVWSEYGDACNWTVGTVGTRLIDEEALANTSELFEIKAYPNPFLNQITLILSNENIESNIAVFDMTGKMIQTIKTSENEVNVGENLASGVYIVNITQGKEAKNIRVVKQ